MRFHRDRSLPGASGSSFLESYQHKMPAPRQVRTEAYLVGGGSEPSQWQQPPRIGLQEVEYRPSRSQILDHGPGQTGDQKEILAFSFQEESSGHCGHQLPDLQNQGRSRKALAS